MTKRVRDIVVLPAVRQYVALPQRLAKVLRHILEAGDEGISSIRLGELGCPSHHTALGDLRKEGAVIEVRRGVEVSGNGERHSGIAFYIYRGWESQLLALGAKDPVTKEIPA